MKSYFKPDSQSGRTENQPTARHFQGIGLNGIGRGADARMTTELPVPLTPIEQNWAASLTEENRRAADDNVIILFLDVCRLLFKRIASVPVGILRFMRDVLEDNPAQRETPRYQTSKSAYEEWATRRKMALIQEKMGSEWRVVGKTASAPIVIHNGENGITLPAEESSEYGIETLNNMSESLTEKNQSKNQTDDLAEELINTLYPNVNRVSRQHQDRYAERQTAPPATIAPEFQDNLNADNPETKEAVQLTLLSPAEHLSQQIHWLTESVDQVSKTNDTHPVSTVDTDSTIQLDLLVFLNNLPATNGPTNTQSDRLAESPLNEQVSELTPGYIENGMPLADTDSWAEAAYSETSIAAEDAVSFELSGKSQSEDLDDRQTKSAKNTIEIEIQNFDSYLQNQLDAYSDSDGETLCTDYQPVHTESGTNYQIQFSRNENENDDSPSGRIVSKNHACAAAVSNEPSKAYASRPVVDLSTIVLSPKEHRFQSALQSTRSVTDEILNLTGRYFEEASQEPEPEYL